jgi:tRNA(Ile)-lysidine synthase
MDPLLQRVQQTIQDYHMFERGHTLLVAVSGGPDSMALLHALHQLREAFAIRLVVAHLNHQMRRGAIRDVRFVEAAAHGLGIPCITQSLDVPAYGRRHKLSPEDAARRVRYAFLQTTAKAVSAHHIALGHTADDQAETVVFRLLRGSGLRGLCGIPPVRRPIVRPLIQVQRRDIMVYLRTHHIPFRNDPSNRQRRYTRNRIRLALLPQLQKSYNPRLVQTLCATAQLLAADEAALQEAAWEQFSAARIQAAPDQVHLRTARLTPLSPALQRRVLRQALAEAVGSLQGFTRTHLAHMMALLRTEAGTKHLALPGGAVVERRYDVLIIYRRTPPAAVRIAQRIAVPGLCEVAALGVTIKSDIVQGGTTVSSFPTGDIAWLDADKVGRDLYLRTRSPGDRFQPLGSPYMKKLKAFLIDAKIPRAERDRLPLVASRTGIAWVAGVRPADWAKVTPMTRVILRLQLIRHAPKEALDTILQEKTHEFPVVFRGGLC